MPDSPVRDLNPQSHQESCPDRHKWYELSLRTMNKKALSVSEGHVEKYQTEINPIFIGYQNMRTQWHEIYLDLEKAGTLTDLAGTTSSAVSMMGFSHWLFEVKSTHSGNDSEFFSDRAEGKEWIKYYKDADFFPGGSPVYAALRTKGLTEWSDGARFVLTQCSWIGADTPALFSIGREATPVKVEEKASNAPYIAWLAGAIHAKFVALSTSASKMGNMCGLTERERELLRWTSLGKTAGEIASIVGLTTRTVYFHLKNAMLKLNASNTLQAVVKAMVLGLI